MKKNDTNRIILDRQYLLEIFDPDVLEIAKYDSLPMLKESLLSYLRNHGITLKKLGLSIEFSK